MGKLNEEHGKYPAHYRTEGGLKSYNWCINNNIIIGPIPLWGDNYGNWTVQITMNGKTNTDPAKYEKASIMHKVYEYCDYYYNKYKKDEE
tara:strand:- start:167 stop:436 length:270 start_codon:yes stop_codon:yes gene_type:complete